MRHRFAALLLVFMLFAVLAALNLPPTITSATAPKVDSISTTGLSVAFHPLAGGSQTETRLPMQVQRGVVANVIQSSKPSVLVGPVQVPLGSGGGIGPQSMSLGLSPQVAFGGALYYVPITLTNNQNSAVPGGTQVLLTVNWSTYGSYLDSNVDNVGFFDSAFNPLYAWVETNAASSATASNLWVKLNSSGIAANGTTTIYLAFFALGNSNFSSGYWGEAPTLSGTFGQNDNGANVFDMYVNFQGSSLPSGWTLAGQGGFLGGSSGGVRLVNNAGSSVGSVTYGQNMVFANNEVIEASSMYSGTADDFGIGFYSSGAGTGTGGYGGCSNPGFYMAFEFYSGSQPALLTNCGTTWSWGSQPMPTSGTNYMFSQVFIYASNWVTDRFQTTTSSLYQAAPGTLATNNHGAAVTISTTNQKIFFAASTGGATSVQYLYWARTRVDPPNDAMPSASFGSITSSTPGTVGISSSPGTGSGFLTVNGTAITTPYSVTWPVGDTETLAANSPVSCGPGCQYIFLSWSDGGAQTHNITVPSTPTSYVARYQQQYQLTMAVTPSGSGTTTPSPGASWQSASLVVSITGIPNSGYVFSSWTGSGSGSFTGLSNPATVTMNAAITETVNFVSAADILYDTFVSGFNSWTYTSAWPNGGASACSTSQFSLTYDTTTGDPAPSVYLSGSPSYANCYAMMQKTASLDTPNPTFSSQLMLTFNYLLTASTSQNYNGYYNTNLVLGIYSGATQLYWTTVYNQGTTNSGWQTYGPVNIASYVNGHSSFTVYIGTYSDDGSYLQKDWIDNVHLYYVTPVVPITITTSPTTGYWFITVDGFNVETPYTVNWTPSTTHTIAAYSITPGVPESNIEYVYSSWSDGGSQSHNIVVPSTATTYTATYTSQPTTDVAYDQFSSGLSGWAYATSWPSPAACTASGFSLVQDTTVSFPAPASSSTPTNPSALVTGSASYANCYAVMQKTFTVGANYPNPLYLTFNYRAYSTSVQNYNGYYAANIVLFIYSGETQLYSTTVYNGGAYDTGQAIFGPFNIAPYVNGYPSFTVLVGLYSDVGSPTQDAWFGNVHICYPSSNLVSVTVTSSPATGYWFATVDGFNVQTPYTVQWTAGTSHTITAYSPVPGASGSNVQYVWQSWSDGQGQSHTIIVPTSATTYTATYTTQTTTDIAYDLFTSGLSGWTYTSPWPNPGAASCSSGFSLAYSTNYGIAAPSSSGTPPTTSALLSGSTSYGNCYVVMQKTYTVGSAFPSAMYLTFNYRALSSSTQNYNGYYAANVVFGIYDGQNQLYWATVYNSGVYDSGAQFFVPFNIASYVNGHSSFTVYVGFYTDVGSPTQQVWLDNIHLYYPSANIVPVTITSSPATGYWFVTVDGFMRATPYTAQWTFGSSHTIAAYSIVPGVSGSNVQYAFSSWSDGGSQSHTIYTPSSTTTYTANFQSQPTTDVIFDQFTSDLSGWTYTTAWPNYGGSACPTSNFGLIYDTNVGFAAPASSGITSTTSAMVSGSQSYGNCYAVMQKTVTLGQNYPSSIYVTFNYRALSTSTQNYNGYYAANVVFGIYDGENQLYFTTVYNQGVYDSDQYGTIPQLFGPINIASYVNGHSTFTILIGLYSDVGSPTQQAIIDNVHLYYPTTGLVPITITSAPSTGYWFVQVDGLMYPTPYTVQWTVGTAHTINAYSIVPGTQGSGVEYTWSSWSDGNSQSHTIYVPSSATTYTANYATQPTADLNYDEFTSGSGGWTYGASPGVTTCSSSAFSLSWVQNYGQPPPASTGTPSSDSDLLSGSTSYGNCYAMMYKTISLSGWSSSMPLYLTFNYRALSSSTQNYNGAYATNAYYAIYAGSTQLVGYTQIWSSGTYDSTQYGSIAQIIAPVNIASKVAGQTSITVYIGLYSDVGSPTQEVWVENVHLYYVVPSGSVTITTSPAVGSGYVTVDGTAISTPQTFNWAVGSTHTLAAVSPVSCGAGCQYVWQSWSDGGAQSHTYTVPSSGVTVTANFLTQYQLTMQAGTGGSVSPSSAWYNSGLSVQISASPNSGYAFSSWSGSGSGAYSGSANPATITMNGPITETASFGSSTVSITIASTPSGAGFVVVDGSAITTPDTFTWAVGSEHVIAAESFVSGGTGVQYLWESWSDGGAESHTYTVPSSSQTITAVFGTQYYLTVSSVCGSSSNCGSPTPASGWFNASNSISASVSSPVSGGTGIQYVTTGWTGTGSAPASGSSTSLTFTIEAASSITWNWKTQYQLTIVASPSSGGSVSPSAGTYWYDADSVVQISASPASGYNFTSWSGTGTGSYSGSSNPASITMNAAITETANFNQAPTSALITITSTPTGSGFVTVDGSPVTTPQTFSWIIGSTHTLAALSPLSGGSGAQYVFVGWSDESAQSHTYTVPSSPQTVTATFKTRYQLNVAASPSGSGTTTPSGAAWYDVGTSIPIQATADPGYVFASWLGTGSGSYSGTSNSASVTMNGPINETCELHAPSSANRDHHFQPNWERYGAGGWGSDSYS